MRRRVLVKASLPVEPQTAHFFNAISASASSLLPASVKKVLSSALVT